MALAVGLSAMGPNVCGNVNEKSGYPCYLLTMIKAWRAGWSAVPGTTDPEFPFGIQTLQSTEGDCGNGAFRWAQALNEATLPSASHPKIFLAQGFDAQDPTGDANWPTGVRGNRFDGINGAYPMAMGGTNMFTTPEAGAWDGTGFLMGPIHPRDKHLVGRRMALAAATTAYPDDVPAELKSVGPTLKNCSLGPAGLTIFFDETHMKDDAIHVFPSLLGPDYDLPKTLTTKLCAKLEGGAASPFCSSYGGVTPLEVEYTVPTNGTNVSVWVPTSMRTSSLTKLNKNCKSHCTSPGKPAGCCTNWTRTAGWNSLTTHVVMPKTMPTLPVPHTQLSDYITGVRCETELPFAHCPLHSCFEFRCFHCVCVHVAWRLTNLCCCLRAATGYLDTGRRVVCFPVLPIHWRQSSVPSKRLPNPRLELDLASQPVFRQNCRGALRMHPASGLWLVAGNQPVRSSTQAHAVLPKTGAGWVCEYTRLLFISDIYECPRYLEGTYV